MKKIYSYNGVVDSQLQRPGSMGLVAQGHLSRDKEVNCHTSSILPPILLLSSEWGLN